MAKISIRHLFTGKSSMTPSQYDIWFPDIPQAATIEKTPEGARIEFILHSNILYPSDPTYYFSPAISAVDMNGLPSRADGLPIQGFIPLTSAEAGDVSSVTGRAIDPGSVESRIVRPEFISAKKISSGDAKSEYSFGVDIPEILLEKPLTPVHGIYKSLYKRYDVMEGIDFWISRKSNSAWEKWSTVQVKANGTSLTLKDYLNQSPTLSLTTLNERTLYESDPYVISGTAQDTDAGDVVMVKYKINNGTVRTITSPVSTGASFPFNRSLTFKSGALYDGATAVTPALAEGTQHVLTVWAEDDKGGKSAEVTRTFYVVPNRPPTLTVDPITPKTDMINSDSFEVKGTVNNPDANGVKVEYKVGNSAYTEAYSSTGAGGAFSFRLNLSALANGANSLTIRATDHFGAVDSKVVTVTKSENVQPLKEVVTRYKLTPPNGTAKGVLLWIERETGDLVVDAEISMTNAGEPESFVKMTKSATAFVQTGIEEDEFVYDAVTAKANIILKITMTRTSTASNKGITLISGVLS